MLRDLTVATRRYVCTYTSHLRWLIPVRIKNGVAPAQHHYRLSLLPSRAERVLDASRRSTSQLRLHWCSSRIRPRGVRTEARVLAGAQKATRASTCSVASPLLRIGAPSLYAPSPALPSVDPAVLRSYPLPCASCYEPKHGPGALVAIGTSLAGAQTTPPETQKSSPKHKKLQKSAITRAFITLTSPSEHPSPS
jgi:hypothetical protein